MDMNNIYKTFEVTIIDEPISELEATFVEFIADQKGYNLRISQSGRIITMDGVDDIKEAISIIAAIGFAEDVGLIKEITTYEPVISLEDMFNE